MKVLGEFIKSTLIGGLLVILPLGLIVFLTVKALGILKPMADPIAEWLPEGFRYPVIIGVVLLLLLCFTAGLLAGTRVGQSAGTFLEDSMLDRIPGYSMLRSLTRRVGNVEESRTFAPAFVELEETLVLAFLIERHDDGKCTVFVPSAPTPAAGAVYIMDRDRVHLIDAPFMDAVKCVSKFGAGSAELLKSLRQPV